jgi:hypothetical protein
LAGVYAASRFLRRRMTYLHNGKQYIVVAVSQSGATAGAELIAYALP